MNDLTAIHDLITTRATESLEAVRDWIRVPSFSDTGVGIPEGAEYTKNLLERICPDATIYPSECHPFVMGTVRSNLPDTPWLIAVSPVTVPAR